MTGGTGRQARVGLGLLGGIGLALLLGTAPSLSQERVGFRVAGGTPDLVRDLRNASLLLTAEAENRTGAQDLFATARAEYGRLVAALYAQGHYSPVVRVLIDGREAGSIPPLDAPARIGRIEVIVDPGPAFAFGRTRIAPLAPGTELPDGFAPGERARSGVVREAVGVAVDQWRESGNAKVEVAGQTVVADHARRSLDADIALAPGPRLRFGPLAITGQQRMSERRIRKIAGLPEGEVFSPSALARSADRLRRTGVFRSVSLTEDERITAPDLLGITATLVEELPRRYSIGAEASSFEGVELSGSWLHRNLLGGAERLTLSGRIANIGAQDSGVDYSLGVTLDRPATLTPDTTLSFAAGISRIDDADAISENANLGFTFSHIFSDGITARAGLDYRYSQVEDLQGETVFRTLAAPLGATWDSRDTPLDATEGYYLDVTAAPYLGFGTTNSGARLTLDARAYRSFGERRPVTLAGRVQAGAVLADGLLDTPRDYLFFSGGGGTVRGQPFQSLGVNVLGAALPDFRTGGMTFLGASAEVRASVTERIGVVLFADVGQVGAMDFFDDLGDWHAGAGLGLRYDTGFGPIRLDVAAPVGGTTGDGVQVYIGIGQAF